MSIRYLNLQLLCICSDFKRYSCHNNVIAKCLSTELHCVLDDVEPFTFSQ